MEQRQPDRESDTARAEIERVGSKVGSFAYWFDNVDMFLDSMRLRRCQYRKP